jgi:hypothetical protein
VSEAGGDRDRDHHFEGGVWAVVVVVVVLAPVFDEDLGLGQAGEQLHSEQLVSDP